MSFWQSKKADIYIHLYDDFASSLKTADELRFLQSVFRKDRKIIEFGCGTGRTLVPLLKSGYKISGLDLSKGMLNHLKRKLKAEGLETDIYNKDLTKFALPVKFDGGVLSQRTLNFITAPAGQRKALENIAKILKKNAVLVINLMPARPNDFAKTQKSLKKTETFKNSVTGNKVEFWENWIPDSINQTWTFRNEFREENKRVGTDMQMRVIFELEMKYLLELCGFVVVAVYGNWKKRKYDEGATDMIFVTRKK